MRRTYVYCHVHKRVEEKGTCREKAEARGEACGMWSFNPGGDPIDDVKLPFHWSVPDGKGGRIKLAPHYGKDGAPIFTSQAQIREAVAKAQAHGEPVVYRNGHVSYG